MQRRPTLLRPRTLNVTIFSMCGIVGYVGRSEAAPILLDGLRRLEYRGYDSAGVAIVDGDKVETRKCAGRIAELGKLMAERPPTGTFGISHTRWATHGKPTDQNAHPHFDAGGRLALVHNGVIENFQALKDQLIRDGDTKFVSETDTEVLAHLIGKIYDQSMSTEPGSNGKKATLPNKKGKLVEAVRTALRQVIGTYGIALVHRDIPDFIVGARRGSPLVLGVGKDENFLASDVSAIVAYTRDAVYLNDFDVVAVERDKFEISSVAGEGGNSSSAKSSSPTPTSRRAITRTTCSRRSLSSPVLSATRCAAGFPTKNAPRSSVD